RLRLHGQGSAIGSAGDQQAYTINGDDVHGGVAGVVRPASGRADPLDVAGLFVERDEALGAVRLRAPSRSRGAHDDEVSIDDGRHGPAAVGGERGELFGDGAL